MRSKLYITDSIPYQWMFSKIKSFSVGYPRWGHVGGYVNGARANSNNGLNPTSPQEV